MRIFTRGLSSKKIGNSFEDLFKRAAQHQGFGILRIEDGCRRIGLKKLIPVKQACDFVLVNRGLCAFIDTKTQGDGKTFPRANINLDQVNAIDGMCYHGATGGYVVWFRDINKVIFFDYELLKNAQAGIPYGDGVDLGSFENFTLQRIYES